MPAALTINLLSDTRIEGMPANTEMKTKLRGQYASGEVSNTGQHLSENENIMSVTRSISYRA